MNNRVYYEWRVVYGDPAALEQFDRLSHLLDDWPLSKIVSEKANVELCCRIDNELYGETVCYADIDIKSGEMPDWLTDAGGSSVRKIPKTYKKEFAASELAVNMQ